MRPRSEPEIDAAFTTFAEKRARALFVGAGPFLITHGRKSSPLAERALIGRPTQPPVEPLEEARKSLSRSREARTKHVYTCPYSSRLIENVFHACLHRRGHIGRQLLRHAGEMPGLFGECLCLFPRMLRRQFNERGG